MGRKRRPRHQQLELLTKAGTVRKRRPQTFKRGRKPGRPKVAGSKLRHERRPEFSERHPLHVTWRMERGLPNLRGPRAMAVLRRAFLAGKDRLGFRLVHFRVQRNHVHLICEAADKRALSRGLKGLAVRVARGLNRLLSRHGRVLGDRYHAQVLTTPTRVRWALGYVLCNTRRHNAELLTPKRYPRRWLDTHGSSASYFPGWRAPARTGWRTDDIPHRDVDDGAPVAKPKTYLIGRGWRRLGKLPTDHLPG